MFFPLSPLQDKPYFNDPVQDEKSVDNNNNNNNENNDSEK